ncbi:MAG: type I-PGING CRISPR-associated protein Cas7/Csp1 [Porphyromonas sp.]|nr:type I-PGING CRISPR-associated protein Cas7/Csp1 [Porphyromonas sp.]
MNITGVLVSIVAPFENHIANGGDKLLGNANSIKRRPDGRVYVSGQMQRHVLFSAMDRLNMVDPERKDTFLSNADGITSSVEKDLRADLGGFMNPSKGGYTDRRIAPLSATYAVSLNESNVGRDLLVRIKYDANAKEQAMATKEFSERDSMLMNFHLDVSALSVSKVFDYKETLNVGVKYFKHATEQERKRRVKLYLEATRMMNDYANQARNAICGEPEKVFIVFDEHLSRKAMRYFSADEQEKKNIIAELDSRNAKYFIGDDKTENSVNKAYNDAFAFLEANNLFDPSEKDKNGKEIIMKYEDLFK